MKKNIQLIGAIFLIFSGGPLVASGHKAKAHEPDEYAIPLLPVGQSRPRLPTKEEMFREIDDELGKNFGRSQPRIQAQQKGIFKKHDQERTPVLCGLCGSYQPTFGEGSHNLIARLLTDATNDEIVSIGSNRLSEYHKRQQIYNKMLQSIAARSLKDPMLAQQDIDFNQPAVIGRWRYPLLNLIACAGNSSENEHRAKLCDFVLERGANLDVTDEQTGDTALMLAIKQPLITGVLIKYARQRKQLAFVDLQNNKQETALVKWARHIKHDNPITSNPSLSVGAMLLDADACPDKPDEHHDTFRAISSGNYVLQTTLALHDLQKETARAQKSRNKKKKEEDKTDNEVADQALPRTTVPACSPATTASSSSSSYIPAMVSNLAGKLSWSSGKKKAEEK